MGVGPFSSESKSSQKTFNSNQQQTATDQAVNFQQRNSPQGNVRLGAKATLNQYTTNQTTVQGVTKDELKDLLTAANTGGTTSTTPPPLPFTSPESGGYTPPASGVLGAVTDRVTDQVRTAPAESHARTVNGVMLGAIAFVIAGIVLFVFMRRKK